MIDEHILIKGHVVTRRVPVNLAPADAALFEPSLAKAIPPTRLLRLRDVRVDASGLLYSAGRILPESFDHPKRLRGWRRARYHGAFWCRNMLAKSRDRLDVPALWITDNWSSDYFHWLLDALPRLQVVQQLHEDGTLLLSATCRTREFVRASLSLLGVGPVRFVGDREVLRFAHLMLPTLTAPTGNYNPEIVQGLRTRFRDGRPGPSPPTAVGERVYLSRGKASKRRIANEADVQHELEAWGFRTVHFEDHPFEHQVRMAMNARYLISNHGAGLANMLFMAAGSSVLEMRKGGDGQNNCFFALASALDLRYLYQMCDTVGPGGDPQADIVVDTLRLRRNVELMLAG
jgi:capsular polysaccharide biosynthesis protein